MAKETTQEMTLLHGDQQVLNDTRETTSCEAQSYRRTNVRQFETTNNFVVEISPDLRVYHFEPFS